MFCYDTTEVEKTSYSSLKSFNVQTLAKIFHLGEMLLLRHHCVKKILYCIDEAKSRQCFKLQFSRQIEISPLLLGKNR